MLNPFTCNKPLLMVSTPKNNRNHHTTQKNALGAKYILQPIAPPTTIHKQKIFGNPKLCQSRKQTHASRAPYVPQRRRIVNSE